MRNARQASARHRAAGYATRHCPPGWAKWQHTQWLTSFTLGFSLWG